MREFVLAFLILLMLTPGMACAMPFCVHGQEMGGAVAADRPCHGESGGGDLRHPVKKQAPMSNAACAGIDLLAADGPLFKKPLIVDAGWVVSPSFAIAPPSLTVADAAAIRGPPPDGGANPAGLLPLFLRTQRIRQ